MMEWLESDYQTITHKNKLFFLNKIKSNSQSNKYNCYIFNETNNLQQDLFFITDLKIRLKVKINPKRLNLIKKFYQQNDEHSSIRFICVYLKQYLYSTMVNFRNSKEPFIFMMIDDFDIVSSNETNFVDKDQIKNLLRWDHLSLPGVNSQKTLSTIQFKQKSNLSLLVENLSQPSSNDYTIEIQNERPPTPPVRPKLTDLNEAFANDDTSTMTTNSTISNQTTIEPSFVNNCDPKVSSQFESVEPFINCSEIHCVKSSITITKLNDLTDDDDDNETCKTFQFSPKLCQSHTLCIRETQHTETKKRRKLLDDKCCEEFVDDLNSSLISSESDTSFPSRRVTRTFSSCSSSSTSSSSLSLSSCNTPKSLFFKPKSEIKSEPRFLGKNLKKIKNSHLVFSPLKSKPQRQEKLKEIKKNFFSSTRSYKQLNSPAKLNSVLVDKILNLNDKNIMSSDEDDIDFDKTKSLLSLRRRRLLFDRTSQFKELDKVFDSVNSDRSIPSGQVFGPVQASNENNIKSLEMSLLNWSGGGVQNEDKLQEYLVGLAEMAKTPINKNL